MKNKEGTYRFNNYSAKEIVFKININGKQHDAILRKDNALDEHGSKERVAKSPFRLP